MKIYRSKAQWPDGSIKQPRANDITTDFHSSLSFAKAVCKMLETDGLGGDGKIFPIITWVDEIIT